MSARGAEDNVAFIRDAFAAYQREGVDIFDRIWHPDVELDMRPTGVPGAGVYNGRAAAKRFMAEEWMASFEEYETELIEVTPVDERTVFLAATQRGRGPTSGALVEGPYAHLTTFEDGLVRRMVVYADPDDARRAAGLET